MTTVVPGQVWEVYSKIETRWLRVIVTSVEGDEARLKYEGSYEFVTLNVSDMENRPDMFRRAEMGCSGRSARAGHTDPSARHGHSGGGRR